MAMERDFELIFKTEEGEIIVFYPSTVAKQVILPNGYTAEDHTNSTLHLFGNEVSALANPNMPNGMLQLDEDGYVPVDKLNESMLLVRKEFADIPAMFTGSDVLERTLVMVLDASADPNVDSGWAIYRRTSDPDYTSWAGWTRISESESLDVSLAWEHVGNHPQSPIEDIDQMVVDDHNHLNKTALDNFGGTSERPSYMGKDIAYEDELLRIYASDYYDPDEAPGNSFWLRPLYTQSWWSNDSITDAGTSLYERFANQNSITETPKLLTQYVTTVNRMCYSCDSLETVPQYDYHNCVDFTSQFEDCPQIVGLPVMNSFAGQYFDKQFKNCIRLENSPMMVLDEARSVVEQFSGDVNLLHVLDFGSTAKVTNMTGWFNGCTALQVIQKAIDFTSITADSSVTNMFNGCVDLEKVSFKPGTLKVSLSLANTNLTPTSLENILEGLPEISTEKSLNLSGIPALDVIDEELITSAIQKGWNIITQ